MDVQEKVCEVFYWTQLADTRIYKRPCILVVTDGMDFHLPKVHCFQLKKGNLVEAGVYGTRYYKRSMVGYGLD